MGIKQTLTCFARQLIVTNADALRETLIATDADALCETACIKREGRRIEADGFQNGGNMYLLSIVCVIIITVVNVWMVGGSFFQLFDVISFLFLFLMFIPLLIAGGLFKDFNNAFRLGIGKRKAGNLMELKRAKEAMSLAIKSIIADAGFCVVLQEIILFSNAESFEALRPSIGISFITFFYALGMVLFLLPIQARLNVKMQEFISEKE